MLENKPNSNSIFNSIEMELYYKGLREVRCLYDQTNI